MPLFVSPHTQSHRAVVEDVKLGLVLTTQGAHWKWYLPPQAQVLVVGQGVDGGIEDNLNTLSGRQWTADVQVLVSLPSNSLTACP
jgi:hypothetical protein